MKDIRKKIIIDTDIGDDIDDAMALVYALASGRFEVIGVTTVFKDTVKRARIAKALVKRANVTVPVYAGYGMPLSGVIPESQEINQFRPEMEGPDFAPENPEPEAAVNFITESCRRYGKDLIVLAVGPLGNIARAVLSAPDITENLNPVIMGGCFNSDVHEWNIFCDPEAASVVFEKMHLKTVGVEITSQTRLDKKLCEIVQSPRDGLLGLLSDLTGMWRKAHEERFPTLHDVLALATIVMPELCEWESTGAFVNIEKHGVTEKTEGDNITYAVSVKKQLFFEEFFKIYSKIS